ncbi:hypothetical protein ACJIZ3_001034 [Penstemon smallii]|uniref:ZF-HD dimerization-type domain-containing protein n=1 Tax=Penstemon smallii TaxID=265156 RepID=A0ABD3U475_9LAMI
MINHIVPSTLDSSSHLPSLKKIVKYRECLKNHAASMGGNAVDGCGEFMPSGEEGTLEALNCSVCNCHRNFHRKEIEGEPSSCFDHLNGYNSSRIGTKVFVGHNGLGYQYHHRHHPSSRPAAVPHPMIMSSYNNNNNNNNNMGSLASESDEQEEGGVGVRPPQTVKKRFRTKFTQDQKEKMFNFAEKVGWKIQKQEEGVVQQLCQELGVKRRVLKVWMHNNKHTLAKKNNITNHQSNGDDQNQVQND